MSLKEVLFSLSVCLMAGALWTGCGTEGSPCSSADDCAGELQCYSADPNATSGTCVAPCSSSSDCSGSDVCTPLGSQGSYCIPAGSGGGGGGTTGGTTGGDTTGGTGGTTGGTTGGGTTGGGTTGGGTTGGTTGGGSVCDEACAKLDSCTVPICPGPVIDQASCLAQCEPDPAGFQADLIVSLSCDEINASLCSDPQFAQTCDCGGSGGGDTCADIYQCLVECGQDQACSQSCFDGGSAEGQQQINALLQCFQDFCADATTDAEFQECAEGNCGNEINACFSGGGGGGNAFCLATCSTDAECGGDEFCFLGLDPNDPNFGVCAAGSEQAPTFPADSAPCTSDAECGGDEICVQGG